jgi:putative acetyltransferase
MTSAILVEPERSGDEDAIRLVNIAAFDGRTEEADLVDDLRDSGDLLLSLVARQDGDVVGHVAFSRVVVDDAAGPAGAVGLAPVGVRPDMQDRGIGAQLIETGLGKLAAHGESVVLVVGSPGYYTRFGFSVSAAERYSSSYSGPHFMALLLTDPGSVPRGPVIYPDAFGLVT